MTPEFLTIRWEERAARPVTPIRRWEDTNPIPVLLPPPSKAGCDFCGRDPESEAFAVFDGVSGKLTGPDGRTWWATGPFGACRPCQRRLGISPGDEEVALAKVRRLFSIEVKRQTKHPVRADFYGPG